MSPRDRFLAVVVAVVWGGNFVAIHFGLEQFPPLLFAGLRFAVMAIPTLLLVPRPRVPLRWLLAYGFGFGVLQFSFLFIAMAAGMPTGLSSLVLQMSAPFTIVLGVVLMREHISRRQVVGIVLAVLGLAAIAVARAEAAAVLPIVLTLVGALGWAIGNLASRVALRPGPDGRVPNAMHLMLWMTTVPPIPLFAVSLVVEGPAADGAALASLVAPSGLTGLLALGYVVVLGTVAGSGLWTWLMGRYPAGLVAQYSMLVPVVGVGLSALVLGERPTPLELGAAVVIVGGVLLGTPRPPRARGSARRPAVALDTPT